MNIFDVPEEKVTLINKCLEATCASLNFNVAEIWQFVPITGVSHPHDSNKMGGESVGEDTEAPICLHVYSRFDELDRYKAKVVIVGSSRDEKNENRNIHKISPKLCTIAHSMKKMNSPLWYYSSDPKFDKGNKNPLYGHDYYKVVVAIPLINEYDGPSFRCCIVFFSVNAVRPFADVELFLEHMSKACILALTNDIHTNKRESLHSLGSSIEDGEDIQGVRDHNVMKLSQVDLDVQWSSLEDIEYLADGSKFTTYHAKYNSTNVAVKVVRKASRDIPAAINYLETEMSFLLRCRHPYIVRLLGAGTTPERFLVTEWVDGGNFLQLLRTGHFLCKDSKYSKMNNLPLSTALHLGRQLAEAMHYLNDGTISDKTVIHGDLRPSNIGFCWNSKSEEFCIKLLDFGLAREIDPNGEASIDIIGSSSVHNLFGGQNVSVLPLVNFYMAPEVAEMRSFTEKADIFSFAMVMWSLITFKAPFAEMDKNHYYAEVVRGNTRPPLPANAPEELKALLISCWDEDPTQRPSFADIIAKLQNIDPQYAGDDNEVKQEKCTTTTTTTLRKALRECLPFFHTRQ